MAEKFNPDHSLHPRAFVQFSCHMQHCLCCLIVSTLEYVWLPVVKRPSLSSHLSHILTPLSRNQRQGEQRQGWGRKGPPLRLWKLYYLEFKVLNTRRSFTFLSTLATVLRCCSFILSVFLHTTLVTSQGSRFPLILILYNLLWSCFFSPVVIISSPNHTIVSGRSGKAVSLILRECGLIRLNLHGNPFRLSREIIIDQTG